jgi:transcriptional regulator with XRE-family HTH domain
MKIQLRTVREQAGVSQEDLAYAAHMDAARLSSIEWGSTKPTPQEADALCLALQSKMGPIGGPLRQSLFEPALDVKFRQATWDILMGRMPAPTNGRY